MKKKDKFDWIIIITTFLMGLYGYYLANTAMPSLYGKRCMVISIAVIIYSIIFAICKIVRHFR